MTGRNFTDRAVQKSGTISDFPKSLTQTKAIMRVAVSLKFDGPFTFWIMFLIPLKELEI